MELNVVAGSGDLGAAVSMSVEGGARDPRTRCDQGQNHSFCKECLQEFWRTKETQECPVCRRRSSNGHPPINLALQNLCESFLKERNESCSSGSEEICSLHSEKLKLFCLEDKQPVCLVCRDSQQHVNHKFSPISEAVSSYKEELNTALKSFQQKFEYNKDIKEELEEIVQHIKSQAELTEHQIKQQFEKLHQFLRDEEEATITALREEEEQKKQMMKEKLEEMNRHISALSHTIKDMEEMMTANDVCFLKEFPVTMERTFVPFRGNSHCFRVLNAVGMPLRDYVKARGPTLSLPSSDFSQDLEACIVVSSVHSCFNYLVLKNWTL
ncbi:Tripartite motif-containing protein 35 [Anabarilius grahami]|uniref:Tripartite motif-containing protein 35 n=1 Tax=Anabarilius grahami TaxID=495550 RepID=A0A3N0XJ31_ANAGA|nr:Tripartite motif-containing protein 35 [Anabarilius grahami]